MSSATTEISGAPAIIDPELVKMALRAKVNTYVDSVTPVAVTAVKEGVACSFECGRVLTATALKMGAEASSTGGGILLSPAIDTSTESAKNSSMEVVDPKLESSIVKTADLSKKSLNFSTDKSVDSGLSWQVTE